MVDFSKVSVIKGHMVWKKEKNFKETIKGVLDKSASYEIGHWLGTLFIRLYIENCIKQIH